MEREGVVRRQQEPTPWVNSVVTVTKANGKVGSFIDPRDLNKAILREYFPIKTTEDVISEIGEATVFTKLDATSGFVLMHPVQNSVRSIRLLGRTALLDYHLVYSFTRLPFGIKVASEVYLREISEMV